MDNNKKVSKISYEEYQKLAVLIVDTLKEYERESGDESIQQKELIDKVVGRLELDFDEKDTS